MAFSLPDLPYAHDALASKGMSAETLEFHHDLHHNAYVTNGNKAIEGTDEGAAGRLAWLCNQRSRRLAQRLYLASAGRVRKKDVSCVQLIPSQSDIQ